MANQGIEKREGRSNMPERVDQGEFFTPLVDIAETDDAFCFQADLPGVKAGDVDVNYDDRVLSISGKVRPRQRDDQSHIWQEYGVGNFHREFTINTPINVDGIRAELKNGELTLTVPKAEHARTRKVQIQAA